MLLKGNTVTLDKRLDRVRQFDERSRQFPVTAHPKLAGKAPRSYSWAIPGGRAAVLDQGAEGACVGFGWTGLAESRPKAHPRTNDDARKLYQRAKQLDEYPGEDYEGSSVLAGAKASVELGAVKEYRWAFGLDDVVLALGYAGPVVLGIPWYDSMYNAPVGAGGRAHIGVSGVQVGAHCILARAVHVGRQEVLLRNSWGADWGVNGDAWVSFADLDRLLHTDGEACVPIKK